MIPETEHPILFTGEMVKAILDGKKTQTRRIIKQVPYDIHCGKPIMDWGLSGVYGENDEFWMDIQTDVDDNSHERIKCPYGNVGDELWVREKFYCVDAPGLGDIPCLLYSEEFENYQIDGWADNQSHEFWDSRASICSLDFGVHPSIHMPRRASRIQLKVTGIRIERLQDICGDDAVAEGITTTKFWTPKETNDYPFNDKMWDDYHFWNHYPQIAYKRLWESINAKRGFGWDMNPWVWCISFERMEK